MMARQTGDHARAEALLRDALDADAGDREARLGLATSLEERGRLAEAARQYEILVAEGPEDAVIRASLGHVLGRLGRLAEAADHLRAAVLADPASATALETLGAVLAEMGRSGEAEAVLGRALALDPTLADAHNHLGNALHLLGRHGEAIASYRRALVARPDFAAAHSNLIYTLSLDPTAGPETHRVERAAWWRAHGERHAEEAARPHDNARKPEKRLRVGYVSGHFRRESAAMSFAPILLAHDPAAVEWICYSGTERQDDVTELLRAKASLWRDTAALDDPACAELVRADGVDILVDLAGHMYGNRLTLFARRPAPVQVTAWGEATGTGLRTIDALFSDPVHIPQAERCFHVERIVDLPCHIHYGRPAATPKIEARPEDGNLVFGSLNRMAKLGDDTLELWRGLLAALPQARLLLKDPAFGEASARDFVRARLGADARVEFRGASSQAEHLATYNDIDVALDPTPQNGGVTTYEALWMGTPVVALAGRTPPGRTSAAILAAAGLGHLVASDAADYLAKARRAAGDRHALEGLREEIPRRLAKTALGDPALYARAVEARYRELWRDYCSSR